MNPSEIIRIVDSLHREKNIPKELVFQVIESAFTSAAKRQYGEEKEIQVLIDRETGELSGTCDESAMDPDEIGRIGAQTAKQIIIQKIREAERDALIEEFQEQIDELVTGVVQRNDGGVTTVSVDSVEAILPRSEQIPGESYHPNERIRATVIDVRPQGSRVKVVLSRARPKLVQRLFEQEIPEIVDGVISVNALSREAGYRSKVAVSSSDQRVDCVGACVGVRGNRIKLIVDELAGERIDIVRWDEDPEVLIPNALQPAEVEQVLLCDMIGRAIVLVREDQLSLAIGRRGQNVRLASKLCGWDIEIMTAEELEEQIERAVTGFSVLEGLEEDLAQRLVEQGYLSYDDLSVIEPDALMEMGELTAEQVDRIVLQAEEKAEAAEVAAKEERIRQKEQQRADAEAEAKAKVEAEAEGGDSQEPDAESEPTGEDGTTGDSGVTGETQATEEAQASGEAEAQATEESEGSLADEPDSQEPDSEADADDSESESNQTLGAE